MRYLFLFFVCLAPYVSYSQSLPEIELNKEWEKSISQLAPEKLTFPATKVRRVLVFSLHTGFKHWVIPHTDRILQLITDKTGGMDLDMTKDISVFDDATLKQYDVVVLNNTCSIGDHRDIFWDVLRHQMGLDSTKAARKAKKHEKSLLKYVKNGGGLVAIHGGIVMQNKSKAFSEMMGGSFDYHPPQQELKIYVESSLNPLTAAFKEGSFTHIDEPYFFNNAYHKFEFTPLLFYHTENLKGTKSTPMYEKNYVAWIKNYGDGRVFYCSPSHNAQSFQNTELLQFYLNGLQFAAGDVPLEQVGLSAK